MNRLVSRALVSALVLLVGVVKTDPLLALTQAAVRDSAGVQIVENFSASQRENECWEISDEPVLVIGSASGAGGQDLYQVMQVRRLSSGRIVLSNFSSELRIYDAEGRLEKTVGGVGDGPGEFRRLGQIFITPGDSIFAYGMRHFRVTVFDSSGVFVRSLGLDPGTGEIHLLDDGSIVGLRSPGQAPMSRTNQMWRPRLTVVRHSPDGNLLNTIDEVPHLRMFGNSGFFKEVPFSPSAEVTSDGQHVFTGSGESYEIRVFAPDGTLLRLIRNLAPRQLVTDEMKERREADRQEIVARRPQLRVEGGGRPPIPDPPYPLTLPAFSGLMVDKSGNLWVRRYRADGDQVTTWHIYSPDGHFIGWSETPAALRVTEIGSDYVLGIWKDEFDLEYVHLYSLQQPIGH